MQGIAILINGHWYDLGGFIGYSDELRSMFGDKTEADSDQTEAEDSGLFPKLPNFSGEMFILCVNYE